MRLVVQRVTSACVSCAEAPPQKIQKGIVVLCGLAREDKKEDLVRCADKIVKMRLWPSAEDPQKQWRESVASQDLDILLVSQFTLLANVRKGTKPDFHAALSPTQAKDMYYEFVDMVRARHSAEKTKTCVFGSYMQVELKNDGPVTIIYDTAKQNN